MKNIGVITRDCAGVNAALRAIVRTASAAGVRVLGVVKGYDGLIRGDFLSLDRRSVSGIISQGGTILKSARSEAFYSQKGQEQAVRTIERNGLEGLIIIGGNGTFAGAHILASRYGVRVVGVPATIDNDIYGVGTSIGVDTAINVAVEALDKIRDTATSLERIFVVEVMGRHCGYLAMEVALAGGCEEVLLPENDFSMDAICREIEAGNSQGKVSWIIITSEGRARAEDVASAVTRSTGLETRIAVLGHIQRGGRPTAFDRILAARLGHHAVEVMLEGKTDVSVCLKCGRPEEVPLEIAIQPPDFDFSHDYKLLKLLS